MSAAGGASWDGAAEIGEILESFSCGISNFAPSSRGFSAEITFCTLTLQASPSEQHSWETEDTEDPDGEECPKGSACHAGCDTAWSAVNLELGRYWNKQATKLHSDELIALWPTPLEANLEEKSAETPDPSNTVTSDTANLSLDPTAATG